MATEKNYEIEEISRVDSQGTTLGDMTQEVYTEISNGLIAFSVAAISRKLTKNEISGGIMSALAALMVETELAIGADDGLSEAYIERCRAQILRKMRGSNRNLS